MNQEKLLRSLCSSRLCESQDNRNHQTFVARHHGEGIQRTQYRERWGCRIDAVDQPERVIDANAHSHAEVPHGLYLVQGIFHDRVAEVVEQLHAVHTQHHGQRIWRPASMILFLIYNPFLKFHYRSRPGYTAFFCASARSTRAASSSGSLDGISQP